MIGLSPQEIEQLECQIDAALARKERFQKVVARLVAEKEVSNAKSQDGLKGSSLP